MEATRLRRDGDRREAPASSTSSRSRPTRRPMPGKPDRALASMGIYIFNARYLYEELERDIADPQSSHDFGKDIIPHAVRNGQRGGAPVRAELRRHAPRRRAVLARRRHDRRLLGRQHRPHRDRPAAQPVRHALADLDLPAAAAAGQVRAQPGRPARHGDRVAGLGRLHRLGRGVPLGAVLERARAFVLQRSTGRCCCPACRSGRGARLTPRGRRPRLRHPRRHGDRRGRRQPTPRASTARENGITLVTREMLAKLTVQPHDAA